MKIGWAQADSEAIFDAWNDDVNSLLGLPDEQRNTLTYTSLSLKNYHPSSDKVIFPIMGYVPDSKRPDITTISGIDSQLYTDAEVVALGYDLYILDE
jgi:hypothetical protein